MGADSGRAHDHDAAASSREGATPTCLPGAVPALPVPARPASHGRASAPCLHSSEAETQTRTALDDLRARSRAGVQTCNGGLAPQVDVRDAVHDPGSDDASAPDVPREARIAAWRPPRTDPVAEAATGAMPQRTYRVRIRTLQRSPPGAAATVTLALEGARGSTRGVELSTADQDRAALLFRPGRIDVFQFTACDVGSLTAVVLTLAGGQARMGGGGAGSRDATWHVGWVEVCQGASDGDACEAASAGAGADTAACPQDTAPTVHFPARRWVGARHGLSLRLHPGRPLEQQDQEAQAGTSWHDASSPPRTSPGMKLKSPPLPVTPGKKARLPAALPGLPAQPPVVLAFHEYASQTAGAGALRTHGPAAPRRPPQPPPSDGVVEPTTRSDPRLHPPSGACEVGLPSEGGTTCLSLENCSALSPAIEHATAAASSAASGASPVGSPPCGAAGPGRCAAPSATAKRGMGRGGARVTSSPVRDCSTADTAQEGVRLVLPGRSRAWVRPSRVPHLALGRRSVVRVGPLPSDGTRTPRSPLSVGKTDTPWSPLSRASTAAARRSPAAAPLCGVTTYRVSATWGTGAGCSGVVQPTASDAELRWCGEKRCCDEPPRSSALIQRRQMGPITKSVTRAPYVDHGGNGALRTGPRPRTPTLRGVL